MHALIKHSLRRHSSTLVSSKKQIIFSGIQPTGVPHLGNYLGAIRQWVKLQNEAPPETQLFFSIVDLHAITVRQNAEDLRRWKRESLASLIALGLDPKRSVIFYQSSVAAHSELMWILSTTASMGYLSRMTQWKSKLDLPENASPEDAKTKEKLKLGLFSYPVLQAADILLYKTTQVPVGEDQSQHLEFARQCADSFNSTYGPVFERPDTLISPAKRVMSLVQPTKKMSKSDPNKKSRILINDSRADIVAKVKGAMTDSVEGVSYDPERRSGVSNLIELIHHLSESAQSYEDIAADCANLSMRAFKERVADTIDDALAPTRERWQSIIADPDYLQATEQYGAIRAAEKAAETMQEVREAIGLSILMPGWMEKGNLKVIEGLVGARRTLKAAAHITAEPKAS